MRVYSYASAGEAGVPFGRSVREIATEAKRVIDGPPDREETVALLQKIDTLRGECGEKTSAPIYNWLSNLRREVERV